MTHDTTTIGDRVADVHGMLDAVLGCLSAAREAEKGDGYLRDSTTTTADLIDHAYRQAAAAQQHAYWLQQLPPATLATAAPASEVRTL
jgi:hypothetical protein